jgi:hypothetical protein
VEQTNNLPVNEKEFEIACQGDTSKKAFDGKFKTICTPTIGQKARATIIEAQLNNDLMHLDEATKLYHRMVAQCQVRLIAAPDWWIASNHGQGLLDFNILFEVWQKCMEAERSWRLAVWGPEKPLEVPQIKSTSGELESK